MHHVCLAPAYLGGVSYCHSVTTIFQPFAGYAPCGVAYPLQQEQFSLKGSLAYP